MASRAAVAPFERMRTMFMADQSQTTMRGSLPVSPCHCLGVGLQVPPVMNS